MPLPFILGTNAVTGGFNVDNSLRFNSGSTDYLAKAMVAGTSRKTFTASVWLKMNSSGDMQFFSSFEDGNNRFFFFVASGILRLINTTGGTDNIDLRTNRLLKDSSAWFHLVLRVDTTQSTASNRVRIYINGVQETSFATETYPDQNADLEVGTSSHTNDLGRYGEGGDEFNGYMCEYVFCDGQTLAPTSFGEFDEDSPTIWKPKNVSGLTFGNNGFYLEFKQTGTSQNSSGLGADTSGEDHHFAVTNLTAVDQATDTPTNNFAVMNSLDNYYAGSTFSEGNTGVVTPTGATTWNTGTFGVSAGQWYWEVNYSAKSNTDAAMIGIAEAPTVSASAVLGNTARSVSYYTNGNKYVGTSGASYGDTYTVGDIIGVALDMDNAKLYFSKNGTWQNSGDPTSGATGTGAIGITAVASTSNGFYFPAVGDYGTPTTTAITFLLNFGNPSYAISSGNADGNGYGNFEYAPPSGFYALCTKNLAEFG